MIRFATFAMVAALLVAAFTGQAVLREYRTAINLVHGAGR